MDINKRLYRRLSDYFKDNIKLSLVANENVIIVTKDDRVYQFDEYVNETYTTIAYSSDQLIVKTLIEKSIVPELCNKSIFDFKIGLNHSIARTSDGNVYIWGVCMSGVSGNGTKTEIIYKPKPNKYLNDLNIIDMSCGSLHILVLTSNGNIYSWGDNRYGQTGNGSDNECQLIPIKINCSTSEKFKAISCGAYHSIALTEDGRVFGCGWNKFGQLGNGSTSMFRLEQIEMNNLVIEKISCGLNHSLFLTNDGQINAFGYNYKSKVSHPNKFCDIASHWNEEFCAALSNDNSFYFWVDSELNGEPVFEPNATPLKSFDEIFIKYLQRTYRPFEGVIIEFEDSFIINYFYETHYEEKEKLGEGSYGTVFKVNPKFQVKHKLSAIKKIKFKNEKEEEILKELDIYSLISKISHKNIMSYSKFWIEDNFSKDSSILYILMEFCEQSLDDFLANMEKIEFEGTETSANLKHFISSEIFIEILEGVNYLHKQNPPIIHRDLCPDNIMIKMEANDKIVVKIADFGLVTIHKYAEQLHEPDVGHIRYLAPEVGDGGDYDTRADIFSLGMIVRDLFDLYPGDSELIKDTNDLSVLQTKYKNMESLFEKMISDNVEERPNCEEMLETKSLWALNAREFVDFDDFDNFEIIHLSQFKSHPFICKFVSQKLVTELEYNIDLPKSPGKTFMKTLEDRKQSFIDNGWDQSIPVSVDDLCEAGFYYTGIEDNVQCFECSVNMNEWIKGDDPWVGHVMFSPNCVFFKFNKSQEFINEFQNNT